MIFDEKALLGRNSIKMVSHCSFSDFELFLGRFLKRLDPRLLFSREGADSKTQHSGSRISFATFVLLLLHSHHLLDNPPEDQNVKLKKENRPMWTPWKFFLVSIMIILVIFTYKFNQHDKYYKYPDQTIGRRHPAALMKTQNKTETG